MTTRGLKKTPPNKSLFVYRAVIRALTTSIPKCLPSFLPLGLSMHFPCTWWRALQLERNEPYNTQKLLNDNLGGVNSTSIISCKLHVSQNGPADRTSTVKSSNENWNLISEITSPIATITPHIETSLLTCGHCSAECERDTLAGSS